MLYTFDRSTKVNPELDAADMLIIAPFSANIKVIGTGKHGLSMFAERILCLKS